jgi:hypothetical protein
MRLNVLSPVAQKMEKKGALASRLPALDGKFIGLYWNLKSGGDIALAHAGERLKARYPGLQTKMYVGAVGSTHRMATKDDVKRMAQECVAVIGSTAD